MLLRVKKRFAVTPNIEDILEISRIAGPSVADAGHAEGRKGSGHPRCIAQDEFLRHRHRLFSSQYDFRNWRSAANSTRAGWRRRRGPLAEAVPGDIEKQSAENETKIFD